MIPENRRTETARMKSIKQRSLMEEVAVLAVGAFALLGFLVL